MAEPTVRPSGPLHYRPLEEPQDDFQAYLAERRKRLGDPGIWGGVKKVGSGAGKVLEGFGIIPEMLFSGLGSLADTTLGPVYGKAGYDYRAPRLETDDPPGTLEAFGDFIADPSKSVRTQFAPTDQGMRGTRNLVKALLGGQPLLSLKRTPGGIKVGSGEEVRDAYRDLLESFHSRPGFGQFMGGLIGPEIAVPPVGGIGAGAKALRTLSKAVPAAYGVTLKKGIVPRGQLSFEPDAISKVIRDIPDRVKKEYTRTEDQIKAAQFREKYGTIRQVADIVPTGGRRRTPKKAVGSQQLGLWGEGPAIPPTGIQVGKAGNIIGSGVSSVRDNQLAKGLQKIQENITEQDVQMAGGLPTRAFFDPKPGRGLRSEADLIADQPGRSIDPMQATEQYIIDGRATNITPDTIISRHKKSLRQVSTSELTKRIETGKGSKRTVNNIPINKYYRAELRRRRDKSGATKLTDTPDGTPTGYTRESFKAVPELEGVGKQWKRGTGSFAATVARGLRAFTMTEAEKAAAKVEISPQDIDSWVDRYGTASDEEDRSVLINVIKSGQRLGEGEIAEVQAAERSRKFAISKASAEKAAGRAMPEEQSEAAMKAFLGGQAGEVPRAVLDPKSFKGLDDDLINRALNIVYRTGRVGQAGKPYTPSVAKGDWASVNAYWALNDLLRNGIVPNPSNLRHLEDIFGTAFAEEIFKKRPVLEKFGNMFGNIINMPRANITSVDFSMFLRQGAMLLPAYPKQSADALRIAIRATSVGGEEVSRSVLRAMREADQGRAHALYVDIGELFLHDPYSISGKFISNREEAYLSSIAGQIFPWVRASERGYTTFLNKLRWDVMDDMVLRLESKLGRRMSADVATDRVMLKGIAKQINAATGRGPLPFQDKGRGVVTSIFDVVTPVMNAFMFSPRLFTSRIMAPIYMVDNMRGFLPRSLVRNIPIVAKPRTPAAYTQEYITRRAVVPIMHRAAVSGDVRALEAYKEMSRLVAVQMASWFGMGMTFMAMTEGIKKLYPDAGIQIGTDWRSSEFGKISVGASRYDIWSGYTQIARTLGQLVEGEAKSTQTGQVRPQGIDRTLWSFVNSKFAPSVGLIKEYVTGTGFLGQDTNLLKDMANWKGFLSAADESFWTKIFTPLFIRDLSSAIRENMRAFDLETDINQINPDKEPPTLMQGLIKSAPAGLSAFLGMGVQTFRTKDDIARAITRDQAGGSKGYLLLQPFEQDIVDEIHKNYELTQGITRTKGFSAELDNIEQKYYTDPMNRLAQKASRLSSREITSRYYDIVNEFKVRKNQKIRDEYGEEEDPKRQDLLRAQMNPARQLVQDFYDMIDLEGDIDDLEPGEYQDMLYAWEEQRIASGQGADLAAVYMLRMNTYLREIPTDVFNRLPYDVQTRIRNAQARRANYLKGIPEEVFNWQKQMYTTDKSEYSLEDYIEDYGLEDY